MRSMPDPSKKPFCTWPKVAIFFILLVVGAICIWQFAPINDTIEKTLPEFERPEDSGDDPAPTPAPTKAKPNTTFDFMQCADPTSDDCCNGLDTICDLRVDEVMFATPHNAMSTREGGLLVGFNHIKELEGSLEAGYRGLSLDLCNCTDDGVQFDLQFCHKLCDVGKREPDEVLTNTKSFLDANPSEVIMIVIQITKVEDREVSLSAFDDIIKNVSGLKEMMYVHDDPSADWPTLRTLKNDNKRVIVFHHDGPECTDEDPCPEGLHFYFDHAAETEFDMPNVDFITGNIAESCAITRGGGGSRKFFTVNNFVTPIDQSAASTTNSLGFIEQRVVDCSGLSNMNVGMVLVDFWDTGDLPKATQNHNKELARRVRRKAKRLR